MIEIERQVVPSSFVIHKNGLTPVGTPTFEEWVTCGSLIANAYKGVHFCIGDWLNYGEATWGEKYAEAVKQTGFDYQTLADDKWIAASINFSLRKEKLSFGHHRIVASHSPQDQMFLLEQAETLGLSIKQLREQKDILLHPSKPVAIGQVWQLGQHLLYCGDSASEPFVNLCRQAEAHFAFADPPYNAGVAEWDIDFVWQHNYLSDVAPVVAVTPGIAAIKDFMHVATMPYKWSMSYWIDNGMTRGALGFGNWIYVALFADRSLYHNTQDMVRIEDEDMGKVSITGNDHDELKHKGRKPIKMVSHIVELFTKENQSVIDPFLGTGTTLIACEQLHRRCVGAEISPEYCESVIRRWERLTECEAVLCQ